MCHPFTSSLSLLLASTSWTMIRAEGREKSQLDLCTGPVNRQNGHPHCKMQGAAPSTMCTTSLSPRRSPSLVTVVRGLQKLHAPGQVIPAGPMPTLCQWPCRRGSVFRCGHQLDAGCGRHGTNLAGPVAAHDPMPTHDVHERDLTSYRRSPDDLARAMGSEPSGGAPGP